MVWLVFIIGGFLAALAGLMLTGRIASATAAQGRNMIFTVFAAAVIGGISLAGGRGRLIGALSGVILLAILSNILTLSNIATFWIDASFGAIILIALIIASVSGQKSIKRLRDRGLRKDDPSALPRSDSKATEVSEASEVTRHD